MRHMKRKLKDQLIHKGRVVSVLSDATSREAQRMLSKIREAISRRDEPRAGALLAEYNRQFVVHRFVSENVIPDVYLELLTRTMMGDNTTLAEIVGNYGAVGTGSTAAAAGDTQLVTELLRKVWASRSYSGKKAYYTAFYDEDDFNATVNEHAVFANATAVANSGNLESRVVINGTTGVTKDDTKTLTIEHEITQSDG